MDLGQIPALLLGYVTLGKFLNLYISLSWEDTRSSQGGHKVSTA